MAASLGYAADQLKQHPEVLRAPHDGATAELMLLATEETLAGAQHLHGEAALLGRQLTRALQREDLSPPDLLRLRPVAPRHFTSRSALLLLLVAGAGALGCVFLRRST